MGIVDFEIRFPASRANVGEMQVASGLDASEILAITHCEEFPVLGEFELAWELGAEAGRALLARTEVAPEAVGHLLYAGSAEWDLPFWSPAAKVANELGIERAHCFEVANFCNAAMTALQVAVDKVQLGRSEQVLVVVADRLSRMVDYADPGSKALFNFGDAAAAVLVGGAGVTFEVLHSAMRTDPSWCDYYAGEYWDDGVLMRRRGHRDGLSTAYLDNFSALVNATLTTVGRKVDDVAFLLINQGNRNVQERLLDELGIPVERSVFNYERLGHMGSVDPLIALGELRDAQRLLPGDLVLMASSAMGFSWAVTAVEYRG